MPTPRERLRLGYTHCHAHDIRVGDWVSFPHFYTQVIALYRDRSTTYVRFRNDSDIWHHWRNGFTLCVRYPRP